MRDIVLGEKEYFKGIDKIQYEGRESDNPLAFKYYNPEQLVGNKALGEHLRFAVAYWHSFCNTGTDPFGAPTKNYPWDTDPNPLARARARMDAAFEFITKLGVPFYCTHDTDLVDEGDSLKDTNGRLGEISDYALEKQAASGVGLLWGTANLFSHPRYMNGAATNPDFHVVAYAGAQVKNAIDLTIKLGGLNYVFWGGREGYLSLLNTDMKKERENLARFLHMAKDYGRANGFKGWFFIEPKPMEPAKHQYDYDAATVISFMREFDLMEDFKLNIEVNHATLAGHTFEHELQVAADAGVLGSIDANRGDYQNGWDTDQFPVDLFELVQAFLVIQEADGLQGGGINFDAKTRRNSTDPEDLFYAHIGGMDAFARAYMVAHRLLTESPYLAWKKDRYSSFDSGKGRAYRNGKLKLKDLENFIIENGAPELRSGRQELFENLINDYI